MKKPNILILFFLAIVIVFLSGFNGCWQKNQNESPLSNSVQNTNLETITNKTAIAADNLNQETKEEEIKIIFLHHSTGEQIWYGGVPEWFEQYNTDYNTNYQITEQNFPKDSPYGWENYPYDYWNIWVNNAGDKPFRQEPTLEILTQQYNVIIWKHCFPVSDIEEDLNNPDISSSDKRLENYKLQYTALKNKMLQFPDTKFIVWTGAAQVKNATDEAMAKRAKEFFDWVRNDWDESGDNIFLWDFWQLETEGGLYLKNEYAESQSDSHPNSTFSQTVAPLFGQRTVDVIEDRGDSSRITGE